MTLLSIYLSVYLCSSVLKGSEGASTYLNSKMDVLCHFNVPRQRANDVLLLDFAVLECLIGTRVYSNTDLLYFRTYA